MTIHRSCLLLLVLTSCSQPNRQVGAVADEPQPDSPRAATIEALALAVRGSADWHAGLLDGTGVDNVFTIQVQRRLEELDGPVVFAGELADIVRTASEIVAVFNAWEYWLPISFRLTVSPAQSDSLMQLAGGDYQVEFVIAARVSAFTKPDFTVSSRADGVELGISWLELEVADFLVAEGELIGFARLPD